MPEASDKMMSAATDGRLDEGDSRMEFGDEGKQNAVGGLAPKSAL